MNPKTKEDFDLLYHTLESEYFTSVIDSCWCDGCVYCIASQVLFIALELTILLNQVLSGF